MIPAIGILIAAYVITQMLALIYTPPTPTGRVVVGTAAGTTIAVALAVVILLLRRGAEIAEWFTATP
jgi:hypothetical protein